LFIFNLYFTNDQIHSNNGTQFWKLKISFYALCWKNCDILYFSLLIEFELELCKVLFWFVAYKLLNCTVRQNKIVNECNMSIWNNCNPTLRNINKVKKTANDIDTIFEICFSLLFVFYLFPTTQIKTCFDFLFPQRWCSIVCFVSRIFVCFCFCFCFCLSLARVCAGCFSVFL
jgi:hypothetical protein